MTTLVIATRNKHKTEEIRTILGKGFTCLTLDDFPSAPPVEETGKTFEENAAKKAVELARWLVSTGQQVRPQPDQISQEIFVLADDSGLEVDALNSAPGVYSARFAGLDTGVPGNSSDGDNNAKLLRLMEKIPMQKRSARFRCALALTSLEGIETKFFSGACEGRIMFVPSGKGGFGYDPLFVPDGYQHSFADLGEDVKNKISHRAKALHELAKYLVKVQ
jgi:XTP/dITP diphosphohydrolase